MPMIEVSDEDYARLAALAQPFVDTKPGDVVHRVLVDREEGFPGRPGLPVGGPSAPPMPLEVRTPRERGVKVDIGGHVVTADSVRDLYYQALGVLLKNGWAKCIRDRVPHKTSSRRYLVSDRPVHPNGNAFVVPVERDGLFMEAHKSYRTAVSQLAHFLSKCHVTLRYLG